MNNITISAVASIVKVHIDFATLVRITEKDLRVLNSERAPKTLKEDTLRSQLDHLTGVYDTIYGWPAEDSFITLTIESEYYTNELFYKIRKIIQDYAGE